MAREIVVNGRFLARRITGVERYGREILLLIGDSCRVERPGRNLNEGMMGHVWEQFILPRRVNSLSTLWSPANTGPLWVSNQILTIQDLSPLEHPEWFQTNFAAWYRLYLPLLAKRVRKILVPSEYVKRKVESRFGVANILVTSAGVNKEVFHPCMPNQTLNLPARYVLFVGSLEPRKNLPMLLQAWDKVKGEFSDAWLVIAGDTGKVFHPINLPHRMERVRFLGYVPDVDLPSLYAGAKLFVFPSLDEGFGLPVLEAMACGTPVIVSNGGALPEVIREAGIVFNLSETDGLSKAMTACLSDEKLCLSLREKGLLRASMFSWQKTAELIWKALNEP
jgi:glycosyltransferase involved in cell wall biosynthesis